MPLEEVCKALGIEMDELIEEIEAIVNSGTKIDIDYYLRSILDEEIIDDIFAYFREEAESDSIEDAIADLEDEYSEEEIRLVRIKFLSEVAN
jgi:ATP-dependent DNA helicase RecQ